MTTPKAPPSAWPADKVERRPLASLIAYANNARIHSAEQIGQIVNSMREWGWTNPVLVDERGRIIAGHGRVLAAKRLGWDEAPVMIAVGWTEAQKRAYTIADNQLPMNASWHPGLLSLEVGELKLQGFDLTLTGLDAGELQRLDAGNFAPNLQPATAGQQVTQAEVDAAKQRLDGAFIAKSKQTIIDVDCPHCGQKFGINREEL